MLARWAEVGDTVPLDGPDPWSKEFALWASVDAMRLFAGYRRDPLERPGVHVWQAEVSAATLPMRDWRGFAQVVYRDTVPGATHLDIVRSPAFVARVKAALEAVC